ncbi:SNF2 domain-containing protein CLASSY 3 [Linum perenne]
MSSRWTRSKETKLVEQRYKKWKRERDGGGGGGGGGGGKRSGSGSSAQDNYNVRFGRGRVVEEEDDANLSSSCHFDEEDDDEDDGGGVVFLGVVKESDEEKTAEDAGTGESKVGGSADSDTVQDEERRSSSEDDDDLIGGFEEVRSEPEAEENEEAEIRNAERVNPKVVIDIEDSESEHEAVEKEHEEAESKAGERENEEEVLVVEEEEREKDEEVIDVEEEEEEAEREKDEEVIGVEEEEEEEEEEVSVHDVYEGIEPSIEVVQIEEDEPELKSFSSEEIAAETGEPGAREINGGADWTWESSNMAEPVARGRKEEVIVEEEKEKERNGVSWNWAAIRTTDQPFSDPDPTEGFGSNGEVPEEEQEQQLSSEEDEQLEKTEQDEEIERLWEEMDAVREEEAAEIRKKKVAKRFGRSRDEGEIELRFRKQSEKVEQIIGAKEKEQQCMWKPRRESKVNTDIGNGSGFSWAEAARNEVRIEPQSPKQPFSAGLEEKVEEMNVDVDVATKKKQQCMWKPSRVSRKVFKESEVVNILAESVLRDEIPVNDDEENDDQSTQVVPEVQNLEEEDDEQPPAERNEQRNVITKRLFGVDPPSAPEEKSEQELEMDRLWEEMEVALYETRDTSSTLEEDVSSTDTETEHRGFVCREHDIILDEEIGLLCRICGYVELEIRYVIAPFVEKNYRYSSKGKMKQWERDMFDDEETDPDRHHDNDPKLHHGEGTVWDIIPEIRDGLHKHQREGFEFLWRNIGGSIRLSKLKSGDDNDEEERKRRSGCIINHAPGTGKTRLSIRFLQTYMKKYPKCRPMIIVPCSMLLTWEAEFKNLEVETPRHNLNEPKLSGKESSLATKYLQDYRGTQTVRWVKLYSWQKESGILLLTYKLFEELAGIGMRKTVKNEKPVDDRTKKVLLEVPGLVILDEGHTARNQSSIIWRALLKVKTQKRIVLSGTPFQNNCEEFFNTLWLARPNFIEMNSTWAPISKKRGPDKELNEAREKWQSMTCHLEKDADDRRAAMQLQGVKPLYSHFVHTYKGEILQDKLPGLRDSVLILEPADFQRSQIARVHAKKSLEYFYWERVLSLASVHPYLLVNCKDQFRTESVDESTLNRLKLAPEAGVKTKFLMELITICDIIKEKILVFSQYLDPLEMIASQLETHRNWSAGTDFLYIHGSISLNQRQSLMKKFNDPCSEAKVLLASTRACSEGISLIGASRVVLLDVVWNPSVARQAISRAYRLGQTRVVHVYNLIASGTIEEDKYKRQMKKDQLSEMVLFSSDRADCGKKLTEGLTEDEKDRVLEMLLERENLKGMFKEIIYQPKDSKDVADGGGIDLQF